MQPQQQRFYVGVDGGGTKCRAVIVDENNTLLGEGLAGPANPYQNTAAAMASVNLAIEQAIERAGLNRDIRSELVVGLGLAGVNVPSVFNLINQWAQPYAAWHLTTDLNIACMAAHKGADGAVMVVGTGSCGFASVNGYTLTLGAHGFPCGDKASGAWLGLSAVQAVLLAADKLAAQTDLSALINDYLQVNSAIAIIDKLNGAGQSDYARLAPLVFKAVEQGDDVALALVKEAAAYLNAVAEQLWGTGAQRMSMIGGLAEKMMRWMDKTITNRIEPALMPAEFGAVYYARQQEKVNS